MIRARERRAFLQPRMIEPPLYPLETFQPALVVSRAPTVPTAFRGVRVRTSMVTESR